VLCYGFFLCRLSSDFRIHPTTVLADRFTELLRANRAELGSALSKRSNWCLTELRPERDVPSVVIRDRFEPALDIGR